MFCCFVMCCVYSVIGSNIRLMRWLPQASLLAHNKTRLFISHCGLNAVLEAVHYGVPILAVPLSADPFHHAAKVLRTANYFYDNKICEKAAGNYTSSPW